MATIKQFGALCLLTETALHDFGLQIDLKNKDCEDGKLTFTKGAIEDKNHKILAESTNTIEVMDKIAESIPSQLTIKTLGACRVILFTTLSKAGKKVLDMKWQKKQRAADGGEWVDSNFYDMNAGIRLFTDTHRFRNLTDLMISQQFG